MFYEYLSAFKNIFFPAICINCGNKLGKEYLCLECQKKITFLNPPLCRYCSLSIGPNQGSVCKDCLNKVYFYNRLISATAYRPPLPQLIHLFKYKNYDHLANFLASLIIKQISKIGFDGSKHSFITSIPMHRYKLKMRGYNQAELLGKLLSNYFKIPFYDDIISNIHVGPSQIKLPKTKRQKNAEGMFSVQQDLRGKKIIVVDDIFTTGSTIQSCCKSLKEKDAEKITVITLSKTQ